MRAPIKLRAAGSVHKKAREAASYGLSVKRLALVAIYSAWFLEFLANTMVSPLLPYYILSIGGTSLDVGHVVSVFSALAAVASFWMGRASDRWGRKGVFLLSLLGSALGHLLAGFSSSVNELLAARALTGLFNGGEALVLAFLTDIVRSKEQSKFFGWISLLNGIAVVVGPPVGSFFSTASMSSTFFASGISSALALCIAFFLQPSKEAVDEIRLKRMDSRESRFWRSSSKSHILKQQSPRASRTASRQKQSGSTIGSIADDGAANGEVGAVSWDRPLDGFSVAMDVFFDRVDDDLLNEESSVWQTKQLMEPTQRRRLLLMIFGSIFLSSLALSTNMTVLPLLGEEVIGLTHASFGFAWLAIAMPWIGFQAAFVDQLIATFGVFPSAAGSFLLIAVGQAGMTMLQLAHGADAPVVWDGSLAQMARLSGFLCLLVLFGCSAAIGSSAMPACLAVCATKDMGAIVSMVPIGNALGGILGPLAVGYTYHHMGRWFPFLASTVLAALAAALMIVANGIAKGSHEERELREEMERAAAAQEKMSWFEMGMEGIVEDVTDDIMQKGYDPFDPLTQEELIRIITEAIPRQASDSFVKYTKADTDCIRALRGASGQRRMQFFK